MKYFEALKSGRELVVIASDEACDSAIFHMGTDGTLYTYTVNFGEFPRNKTEYNPEQLEKHFENIVSEGGYIFVRGCAFCNQ